MNRQALHERWAALARDPQSPDYYEITEHGDLVVQPVPTPRHQVVVAWMCEQLLTQLGGRAFTGLAIDTQGAGIRVPDVAWLPMERIDEALCDGPLPSCPPVVVEVLAPGDEPAQADLRAAAYLAAGAEDVIVISAAGEVAHHRRPGTTAAHALRLDPPSRMFAR